MKGKRIDISRIPQSPRNDRRLRLDGGIVQDQEQKQRASDIAIRKLLI